MRTRLTDLPVYYINLDSEVDKARGLETWLGAKGFTQIHRWPGVEDPRKGQGCARAHNSLLRHLTTIEPPFIVLEDDVKPWHWKDTIVSPDDTDAYYLGLSKWGLAGNKGRHAVSATRVDGKTWRLYNMLAAHGIVYFSSEYVKWLVRATDAMIALKTNQDKARAQTLKYWNIYAPETAYIYQAGKHRLMTKISLAELDLKNPLELL